MKNTSPISQAMKRQGLTQDQLAKKIGVSRQAVQKWSAGTPPSVENLRKLSSALGVSTDFLTGQSGQESMSRVMDMSKPPVAGFTRVPVLSVSGSCGTGEENEGPELVVGAIDFADSFCHSFPGVTSVSMLEIVSSCGDSMEPTIASQSLVVVDRNQSRLIRDGIFCFRRESDLLIKRVQRRLDGSILLLSDNPAYQPQVVDKEELARAQIIGRVVYVFNGKSIP